MKNYTNLIIGALLVSTALISLYTLTGNASGPAGNYTGAPGSLGTCASCHGSLTSGSGISVSGFPSSYSPSTSYTITVSINNTGAVNGFQATVLDGSNNSAGSFTAGAGSQLQSFGGQSLIAHNTPSAAGSWTFNWTAPSSASGTLTLYVVGNAANGNGVADAGDNIYSVSQTSTASAPVTATVSTNSVTCYNSCDGTASVSASGGTPPYSYSWSSGVPVTGNPDMAEQLCAGSHSVTVTDASSSTTVESFTISGPDSIDAQAQITPTQCIDDNGAVNLTISGGTSPYTVNWPGLGQSGTNVQNLYSGTYTADITDDNGCLKSVSFVVPDTASGLEADISVTQPGCGASDGSITLTMLTGTSPYSYFWFNGDTTNSISGLSAGNYQVTVTESGNNCSEVFTVSLDNPNAPSIVNTSVEDVTCHNGNDGSISFSVQGNPPYTFTWSVPGPNDSTAENLSAGTYNVTVEDNLGCISTRSFSLSQPSDPFGVTVNTTPDTNSNCNGTVAITVSGNNSAQGFTVQWDTPDQDTGTSVQDLCSGTYNATVTDVEGCDTVITAEVGVETDPGDTSSVPLTEQPKIDVSLYPNPSQGDVFADNPGSDREYQIFNMQGSMISSGRLTNGVNRLQIDRPDGMYLMVIYDEDRTDRIVKRIMINR